MASSNTRWDTSYEWKAVMLLGLGFGLVGLDRWIIAPLFPFMLADLGLDLQDQGSIIGILGMAWGVFAIFSGRLSDAIGHRKVLIPAIVLFSLLSGLSGLATGFASLFVIRLLMGVMEGSYCPTSFTATAAASYPSRRGFLQGLQQWHPEHPLGRNVRCRPGHRRLGLPARNGAAENWFGGVSCSGGALM
jgi:MFS family permease